MSSPFKTREFKKLNKLWYGKLKKEGFQDIERQDKIGAREGRLINSSLPHIIENYTVDQFEVKREYYRMAGQFLHEYKFKTALERIIWDMHTQGISVRNIVKKLQSKGHTAYKDLVHGAIKRLAAEMRTSVRKK